MKSNSEAELTILRYLCKTYDTAVLSTLKEEWFFTRENKAIFIVIRDLGRSPTYAEVKAECNSKFPEINIDVWLLKELFSLGIVEYGELTICLDIIEEKYKLRQLETKLMDIHDTMFNKSLADIQTDLIQYFHKNTSRKEMIRTLDEELGDTNDQLILCGDSRPGLNRLGLLKKTVMTIGGYASHHKTNQLIDILVRALMHNYETNPEYKVMMFSGEMSWERIRDRIFAKMFQIELEKIKKRQVNAKEILQLFKDRYPQLISNFILIEPIQFRNVSDLSRIVIQNKPDIWGLDFLQYFAQMSAGNNAEMQNKNVMESIATIKILTEVTNSLGIVLSQLRKRSEMRQVHFPRTDDIEWSGLTNQISDVVGLCFWPYKINPNTAPINWYTVSWQKVRDADPFNEVLWVNPQFCDFKAHPTPNADKKYFDW